jgi:hypothetical protein
MEIAFDLSSLNIEIFDGRISLDFLDSDLILQEIQSACEDQRGRVAALQIARLAFAVDDDIENKPATAILRQIAVLVECMLKSDKLVSDGRERLERMLLLLEPILADEGAR